LPPHAPQQAASPRGNLLHRVETTGAELWMAGAHSAAGDELSLEWFAGAWVLDCAGEMPGEFRTLAGRWEACVFPDIELRPDKLDRLQWIAAAYAAAAAGPGAPARIVSVCHHGMNRSALGAGLILRALGMGAEETVLLLRGGRTGALGNRAFEEIVREPLP
jgi:hypothetical protein